MLGVAPLSASKSPLPSRSHSYLTIEPSGSLEGDASSSAGLPSRTARPEHRKKVPTFEQRLSYVAVGGWLPCPGRGGGGGGGGSAPPPTWIMRSAMLCTAPAAPG